MPNTSDQVILLDARLADGTIADVAIDDGVITSVGSALRKAPGARQRTAIDLDGYVLLPSFVEPHAHLDKALTATLVPNPQGDLAGAISSWLSARSGFEREDIAERAEAAARMLVARGVTTIRTHVDTGPDIGVRAVEALLDVRKRLAGVVDIHIVACAALPLTGSAGATSRSLLEAALSLGADAVGGAPWLDEDPRTALEALADAALRHGLPIDAHVDETLDPGSLAIEHLIELAEAGFPHPITASHAVSLGVQASRRQASLAERLARAGITVVVLPITNLYLQARGTDTAPPRGLAPASRLLRAGVGLAAGGDNVRDPFNRLGRSDPLDIASLLVNVAHLTVEQAVAAVTGGARVTVGLEPVHVAAGSRADLVAIRGSSLEDVVAFAPEDRVVLREGRVVARTRTQTTWAEPELEATPWPR